MTFKNGEQGLPEGIHKEQLGGPAEESIQKRFFIRGQVSAVFAKGKVTAFKGFVVSSGQTFFEGRQGVFADLVSRLAIMLGDMKTVDDDVGVGQGSVDRENVKGYV